MEKACKRSIWSGHLIEEKNLQLTIKELAESFSVAEFTISRHQLKKMKEVSAFDGLKLALISG